MIVRVAFWVYCLKNHWVALLFERTQLRRNFFSSLESTNLRNSFSFSVAPVLPVVIYRTNRPTRAGRRVGIADSITGRGAIFVADDKSVGPCFTTTARRQCRWSPHLRYNYAVWSCSRCRTATGPLIKGAGSGMAGLLAIRNNAYDSSRPLLH